MTLRIFLVMGIGILTGRFLLTEEIHQMTSGLWTVFLCMMLFVVGIGLGQNRDIWRKLRRKGFKILLIPLAVALGSILGAGLIALALGMTMQDGACIGAGFAWYSLSGILLQELGNVELGAISFLSNILREVSAFILIPLLHKYVGPITAIAPCGASSMDTTLPILTQVGGSEIALYGFISGAALTAAMPIIVPILYNL